LPPTPDFEFRVARPSDARAITSFVNATYHGPEAAKGWTPETHLHSGPRTNVERVAAHIADTEARFIFCEDANGLLGCALIERKGDGAYFGMFAVRTASQGGGIGRAIFAEAERLARTLWHCPFMTLTVINLQTDLAAYYERRGYSPTGERQPFPYDEAPGALRTDYDVIVMRKNLA
jgi:GNAT superfamily N-acetyltransferase